jgi:ubiquinol-cytochrome c reductase iron-sulfur subunit
MPADFVVLPESSSDGRSWVRKLVGYFTLVLCAAILYILLDFAIDFRPSQILSSYQFRLEKLVDNQALILRQDNLAIIVLKRSATLVEALRQSGHDLQDPDSGASNQPEYARNSLRSRMPEYFVSYAIGTDLGCPVVVVDSGFQESCGEARYDFAGRALIGQNRFQNLAIPDYTFTNNFNTLTIKP